ncbi:MAG: hypothetical protein HY098_07010 [Nitrospinae bacterium]|nr:hypothetical protein [Nitrospinota bacterium]
MDQASAENPHGPPPASFRGVDVAGWLGEGWRIFRTAPSAFVVSTAIILVVLLMAREFPLLFGLALRPLVLGFYLVVDDVASGRPFGPSRLFKGFSWFFPCLAADLLITIFTTVGLVFLVIPGLVVASWYLFTWLFMMDRGLGFWGAMEASRGVARNDMTGFFLFFLAIIFINVLGALCLVVGLFVSLPVSAASVYAAYRASAGLKTMGAQPERVI